MEYTSIPNIPIRASRLGLGTWAMGGSLWGEANEKDSIDTIVHAFELGINFIDTAPGYGFGASEEVIGQALKSLPRDKIILATKFGLNLKQVTNVFRDSRKELILTEVEDSLRRLKVDYIDLYQVHWPDPLTPQQETAGVLKKLKEQGKIRAIGVSNYTLDQVNAFSEVIPIDAIQHPFNIFEREVENTILAYCLKNKICSIGYSSLCRGLLTGQLTENHEFEDLRKNFDPKFRKPHFSQYLICVGRLKQWVQDRYNRPLTSLAIRWSLDKGVNIALWGARIPKELEPLETILNWSLTQEDFAEIDKIIAETITEPIGPQFMSPPLRKVEDNTNF